MVMFLCSWGKPHTVMTFSQPGPVVLSPLVVQRDARSCSSDSSPVPSPPSSPRYPRWRQLAHRPRSKKRKRKPTRFKNLLGKRVSVTDRASAETRVGDVVHSGNGFYTVGMDDGSTVKCRSSQIELLIPDLPTNTTLEALQPKALRTKSQHQGQPRSGVSTRQGKELSIFEDMVAALLFLNQDR